MREHDEVGVGWGGGKHFGASEPSVCCKGAMDAVSEYLQSICDQWVFGLRYARQLAVLSIKSLSGDCLSTT